MRKQLIAFKILWGELNLKYCDILSELSTNTPECNGGQGGELRS